MTFLIKPIILCGGSGTRLWPFSRESYPKQFVPLIDGKSLLSLTIDRIKQLGSPICVTNEEYRFYVQDLLDQEPNFLVLMAHQFFWSLLAVIRLPPKLGVFTLTTLIQLNLFIKI